MATEPQIGQSPLKWITPAVRSREMTEPGQKSRVKKNVMRWMAVAVVALSTVGLAGCTSAVDKLGGDHTVLYEVGGTAKQASITVNTPGGITTIGDKKLPWNKTYEAFKYSDIAASLIAQNKGTSGKVTCKITVDGKVVAENTSGGPYGIATCTQSVM